MESPQHYGLTHEEWRPYQYESVRWLADSPPSAISILECPTGSGKTAIVTAATHRSRAISVCSTKILQEQYHRLYDWSILMGKSNYECINTEGRSGTLTAEDCLYNNVYSCPYYCPYAQALRAALDSDHLIINYHLWLSNWRVRNNVDRLILDEGHLLPDIVLDWTGITLRRSAIVEWGLPSPPVISSTSVSMFSDINPVEDTLLWLGQSTEYMRNAKITLYNSKRPAVVPRRDTLRRAEHLLGKLNSTYVALQEHPSDWFINSDGFNFEARPLTARYHFPTMFRDSGSVIMSATIGKVETYAQELGIRNYRFRTVPSIWPPSTRPVYVLDSPGMGYKAKPIDFEHQAKQIYDFITCFPSEWPGLILVTRIEEARRLKARLEKLGLSGRVWGFPLTSTREQLRQWRKRRHRIPNSIGITWSLWEGYDGIDEKILIVAKIPFPSIGDCNSYEYQRMKYDPRFYRLQTAYKLEQGLGRVRRGEPTHYDTEEEVRKAVAIADGNLTMVKSYISESLRESLVSV